MRLRSSSVLNLMDALLLPLVLRKSKPQSLLLVDFSPAHQESASSYALRDLSPSTWIRQWNS